MRLGPTSDSRRSSNSTKSCFGSICVDAKESDSLRLAHVKVSDLFKGADAKKAFCSKTQHGIHAFISTLLDQAYLCLPKQPESGCALQRSGADPRSLPLLRSLPRLRSPRRQTCSPRAAPKAVKAVAAVAVEVLVASGGERVAASGRRFLPGTEEAEGFLPGFREAVCREVRDVREVRFREAKGLLRRDWRIWTRRSLTACVPDADSEICEVWITPTKL